MGRTDTNGLPRTPDPDNTDGDTNTRATPSDGPETTPMSTLTDRDDLRELVSMSNRVDRANREYYRDHFDEIQEKYGGQFIVVIDKDIVESREYTGDLSELRSFVEAVRSKYGEDEIKKALITHVPDPEQRLIL